MFIEELEVKPKNKKQNIHVVDKKYLNELEWDLLFKRNFIKVKQQIYNINMVNQIDVINLISIFFLYFKYEIL